MNGGASGAAIFASIYIYKRFSRPFFFSAISPFRRFSQDIFTCIFYNIFASTDVFTVEN